MEGVTPFRETRHLHSHLRHRLHNHLHKAEAQATPPIPNQSSQPSQSLGCFCPEPQLQISACTPRGMLNHLKRSDEGGHNCNFFKKKKVVHREYCAIVGATVIGSRRRSKPQQSPLHHAKHIILTIVVRGVSWSDVTTVPKRKSHRGLDLDLSLNSEVNIRKGWKENSETK